MDYPQPEATAGAPFADPNFKLVVLDALLTSGTITLGAREKLAESVLGPDYDEDEDGYALLKPVYDYLTRFPLTASHLTAVEELIFDGGNEIYPYAFPFWDGETDEFDIRSLEGIGQLANLRSIHVISLLADADLAPLAGLTQLKQLSLDHGPYQNGQALLELPSLKSLSCGKAAFADPALIEALRARGVTLKLF
jgi:hypothetical protein